MRLTSNVENVIAGFYNLFSVGKDAQWVEARTEDLAKTIGARPADINLTRRILQDIGSLEYTMFKNPRQGIAVSKYRLVDPPEVTAKKLADMPQPSISHWRADHGEESLYKRGVLKPWRKDETVYVAEEAPVTVQPEAAVIVLPDRAENEEQFARARARSLEELAPLRKSEPKALVEATRQYLGKWVIANQHIKALVDAGIVKDPSTVLDSLDLEHNAMFDTVALVIPYIDELERRISNLEKFQETLRSKAARVDSLEVELRRTKEQNTRLIAAKADMTMSAPRER